MMSSVAVMCKMCIRDSFEDGSEALLGVDRIFGRGTTPSEVASYLVHALVPTTPGTSSRKKAS